MWEDEAFGNFISGFVEGEGSFYISLKRSPQHKFGFSVIPTFQIDVVHDADLLHKIRGFIGFGHVYHYSKVYPVKARDGYPSYKGNKPKTRLIINGMQCKKLIEFFERFPLRGIKHHDFELWRQAVDIYCKAGRRSRWKTWTKEDMRKIAEIRVMLSGRAKGKHVEIPEVLR